MVSITQTEKTIVVSMFAHIRGYRYNVHMSKETGRVLRITAGCRTWYSFEEALDHYIVESETMADIEGDASKRPPTCMTATTPTACPHIKCTYEGYDGERWRCELCGQSFYLDYDEMR